MSEQVERGKLYELGCRLSSAVLGFLGASLCPGRADHFLRGVVRLGLPVDILTAALSILAISLTQMVLNRQNEREREAHRRDVAMHAKLDELVIASRRARDEMAGIEELDEEDIVELKENAEEARDAAEAGSRRRRGKASKP